MFSFAYNLQRFRLKMLNNYSIPYSKFSPISIADYNTSCRASCCWRISIIAWSAACTAVYEKGIPSTHFSLFLRL